jgi:pimeloyl-ACP methyl ester carboxylesterase
MNNRPFFTAAVRSVTTSRTRVSYRVLGSGPPILFIHGWPLHGATFRDVAAALADGYQCYVIDLPGAGLSPGYDDWSDPLGAHTRTVLEVVEALGLDRMALIGHDSGGAIARHVAAALGDRVTALILSNTEVTGHISRMVVAYSRFIKLPGASGIMRMLLRSRRFRQSKYGFGGCFTDRAWVEGEFYDLFLAPLLADRARFDATMKLLAYVDFAAMADLAPIHARITAPTRFIWGARDRFFPIDGARAMSHELPNFEQLIELPEGRLFLHEDMADTFVSAARQLLDAVIPTTSAAVSITRAS